MLPNYTHLSATVLSLVFFSVAPQAHAFSPPANTGQIQGRIVLSSGGAPVPGASVSAYRTGAPPSMSPAARTAADGSFTISGLASGPFRLCITESTGTLINPCEWTDLAATVTVTDGAVTSGVTVRLRSASALSVRVNDPAQALAQRPGEPTPPHILVGGFDLKGNFHPAMETKQAGASTSYTLSIPCDLSVRLMVSSAKVKLEADQHAPVPAQGWAQMVASSCAKPQNKTFVFSTTGRNP